MHGSASHPGRRMWLEASASVNQHLSTMMPHPLACHVQLHTCSPGHSSSYSAKAHARPLFDAPADGLQVERQGRSPLRRAEHAAAGLIARFRVRAAAVTTARAAACSSVRRTQLARASAILLHTRAAPRLRAGISESVCMCSSRIASARGAVPLPWSARQRSSVPVLPARRSQRALGGLTPRLCPAIAWPTKPSISWPTLPCTSTLLRRLSWAGMLHAMDRASSRSRSRLRRSSAGARLLVGVGHGQRIQHKLAQVRRQALRRQQRRQRLRPVQGSLEEQVAAVRLLRCSTGHTDGCEHTQKRNAQVLAPGPAPPERCQRQPQDTLRYNAQVKSGSGINNLILPYIM